MSGFTIKKVPDNYGVANFDTNKTEIKKEIEKVRQVLKEAIDGKPGESNGIGRYTEWDGDTSIWKAADKGISENRSANWGYYYRNVPQGGYAPSVQKGYTARSMYHLCVKQADGSDSWIMDGNFDDTVLVIDTVLDYLEQLEDGIMTEIGALETQLYEAIKEKKDKEAQEAQKIEVV